MFDTLKNLARPLFQSDPTAADDGQAYVQEGPLLQEVRDLRDTALRLRISEERDWLQAWSYYKGRHWITWREDRWVESEANDRPKITVNYIQHVVQTRLGHLIKNRPMLIGVPGNADEESRNATKTGLKVLEAYRSKLKLAQKYQDALLHMLVTGKSYMKTGWDPYAGAASTAVDPKTGLSIPLGDLIVDVCRCHEVLPESGTKNIPDCQRIEYRTFLPIPVVRRMFGSEKTKDLQPIDPSTREGSGMLRALYGFDGAIPAQVSDRVEVIEVFYRKGVSRPESNGGAYEQGLYAVFAGDKLMRASGTPAGHAEIPLVEFDEIKTDTIYSTSVARGLIDTNKIVDVELSHQEHNRKVNRPKTLMPYQAQIAKDAWDQTDNEVVEFFAPYKPEPYTPASLPGNHIEIRNALTNMIKELGGNFDVLSGTAQSDVRSGRQVAYLQEYAGTVLGVVAANLEAAYEELGNQMLNLLQEYVREDRLEAYVGKNRRMQVVSFKGADLKGMSSVRVQQGSAIPVSRAEKWDRIERWMEKQFIPADKGMKMLDMVDPDIDLYADDEQDRQIADEVCYKLSRVGVDDLKTAMKQAQIATEQQSAQRVQVGLPPHGPDAQERNILRALGIEAFEFENHGAIIDQVNRAFRKTQDYRNASPALRSLADAFVDWHTLFQGGIDPDNPPPPQAPQVDLPPGAPPPGPDGGPGGPGGPPPGPGGPPPGAGEPPPSPSPESATESASGLRPVRPVPTPMHR